MANRLASFASGSNLAIYIGGMEIAYGTNLSWSDDVAHAAVGGIGSYSYDTLEPLQYMARGSFSIVRYGTAAYSAISGTPPTVSAAPGRSTAPAAPDADKNAIDGNTMLRPASFNPSKILIGRTFDITVYERGLNSNKTSGDTGNGIFTLSDCRLTTYSITFTPGQLVSEQIGFICTLVTDVTTQPLPAKG